MCYSTIKWMAAGRNEQGHEQAEKQLKPMKITQVLALGAKEISSLQLVFAVGVRVKDNSKWWTR